MCFENMSACCCFYLQFALWNSYLPSIFVTFSPVNLLSRALRGRIYGLNLWKLGSSYVRTISILASTGRAFEGGVAVTRTPQLRRRTSGRPDLPNDNVALKRASFIYCAEKPEKSNPQPSWLAFSNSFSSRQCLVFPDSRFLVLFSDEAVVCE